MSAAHILFVFACWIILLLLSTTACNRVGRLSERELWQIVTKCETPEEVLTSLLSRDRDRLRHIQHLESKLRKKKAELTRKQHDYDWAMRMYALADARSARYQKQLEEVKKDLDELRSSKDANSVNAFVMDKQ